MNDIPRLTIETLTTRYELEPTLRDIFVEGHFDKEIITRSLQEDKQTDRIVYQIDSVDVPDDLLIKHSFTTGNKQRVIVLSRELANLPKNCSFRCLVDRDFDHWFGPLETTPRLIWTEYSALELYFFSEEILRDIIITTAQCHITDWNTLSCTMINALRDIYILRLADRELAWQMEWISPDRCLLIDFGSIKFDTNEYIKRLLLKNRRGALKAQYLSSVDRWQKKVNGDFRLFIHGHDFIEMLAWIVGKSKGLKEFASVDSIKRIFVLIASRAKDLLRTLK